MKRRIYLNVAVEMTTNDPDLCVGEMENIARIHVKNCIMDNPDADVCQVENVSAEVITSNSWDGTS